MTTVLTLGGAWDLQASSIPQKLRGTITDGRTVKPVRYNNWDALWGAADGANRLDTALRQVPADEDIIVLGHSFGSVASGVWIRTKSASCPIDPERLRFILLGDSIRARNGTMRWLYGEPPSGSRYPVVSVAVQYDKWADSPNVQASPAYWDALNNTAAGDRQPSIHGYAYDSIALDDPHWETAEGNITYMLFPTPMAVADQAHIESAYDRIVKP